MRPCYIFDIDGTLANGDHRLHHIRTEGQKKNWDAYFAAAGKDTPIPHMVQLAKALIDKQLIVFATGRSDQYREVTQEWLYEHIFWPRHLYMRKAGDFRDDSIIKVEMLAQIRADGFEPIMAFDDRDRVVKAWRDAGIPCAQVAPGDF